MFEESDDNDISDIINSVYNPLDSDSVTDKEDMNGYILAQQKLEKDTASTF